MDIALLEVGLRPTAEKCDAVCRHVVNIVEAKFEAVQAEGAAIACAPGCNFCCHSRVAVFAHEAVALLHYLRTDAPRDEAAAIQERIRRNAEKIAGKTVAEHYAARIQCAFLVDGRCAAYGVRPSACARYHSMSRARCEHAYEHPQDVGTPRNARPALLDLQAFGAAVDAATTAAFEQVALATSKGELHQLLRALLDEPNVAERWRAGEDVVATLAVTA